MFFHSKNNSSSILFGILLINIITLSSTSKYNSKSHLNPQKTHNKERISSIINSLTNLDELESEVHELIHLYRDWDDKETRKSKLDSLFSKFNSQNKVLHTSKQDYKYRRQVFEDNIYTASKHNLLYAMGRESYYMKITRFSDLTDKEFMERYTSKINIPQDNNSQLLTNSKKNKNPKDNKSEATPFVTSSDDVDWRRRNIVTPPEFQGECGSCYSFASVGATESAYALETKLDPPILSKQEMVDCGASTGLYLKGCGGGVLESAYKYLESFGVCEAKLYPYIAKVGKCKSYKFQRTVKLSGYSMLDDVSQKGMLDMISKKPTSIAIEMKPRWRQYAGGIIDLKAPCGFFFNHAILAVGYNLKRENGAPKYLILKNSYGDQWGQDGYMYYKLGYGDMGMCAVINSNNSQPKI